MWYCTRSRRLKLVFSGLLLFSMRTFLSIANIRWFITATSMLVLLVSITPVASAAVIKNLYNVEYPVPDQNRQVRSAVFTKGLEEVLIRVSGSRSVLQHIKTGSASNYVQQFSYVEKPADQKGSRTESANASYILKVQYNAGKIINILRDNAQPVWGEHRSEAVVWLAVRDGKNRYILKGSDASLIKKSVETSASRRGVPLMWPVYDRTDQRQLSFADAWAAFEQPVKAASKRYTRGPAIVGRLSWTGSEWKGDWSLFVENAAYGWSLSGSDYNTLIAQGIDLTADEIGKHFAVRERTGVSEPDLLVEINNVDSVQTYRKIQRFLQDLSAVRQTRVARVDQGSVAFSIDLRGDIDDFIRQVSIDKKLDPLADSIQPGASPGKQTVLRYSYRE